jgi:hypothetical protein
MSVTAYRLKHAIVVVARNENDYRLTELPTGSVFLPTTPNPDANGMIEGTCDGGTMLVFVADLEARAELLNIRTHVPMSS